MLLGALVICLVFYQLREALLPFVVGGALAYVLDPFVSWLERRIPWMNSRPELKRVLIITVIFVVAAAVAVVVLIAGITILIHEIQAFIADLPRLIEASRATFEEVNARLAVSVPPELSAIARDAAQDVGGLVVEAGKGVVSRTVSVISQTMSLLLGLAMVPLILFYVLKDREKLIEGMLNTLSPEPRRHTESVLSILNGVFSAYIRGQLLLWTVSWRGGVHRTVADGRPIRTRAWTGRRRIRADPGHRPLARRDTGDTGGASRRA